MLNKNKLKKKNRFCSIYQLDFIEMRTAIIPVQVSYYFVTKLIASGEIGY